MQEITPIEATQFILSSPSYFFSYSEILDYHLAPNKPTTLKDSKQLFQITLSELQMIRSSAQYLNSALTLFKLLHNQNQGILSINPQMMKYTANQDSIRVIHNILERIVDGLSSDGPIAIQQQMSIKVLLNLMYILVRELPPNQLQLYNKQKDIQQVLLKLIQCSLEYSFVPIKKIVIFFYYLLNQKFKPILEISSSAIGKLSDNIITEQALNQSLLQPPLLLASQTNPIETFFSKYNINDCVLAQHIVVGLLRALLNACNSKPVAANNGVDIYREWRASYIYAISVGREDKLPEYLKQLVKDYKEWQEVVKSSTNLEKEKQKDKQQQKSVIQEEADRHRMYTAAAIGSFFTYLLLSFKQNVFLQYTYFIQLISDANGVLVLLKFLTDKFSFANMKPLELYSKNINFPRNFRNLLYLILLLLQATCKNSPDKIKQFLLVYNGFLIFKKIPSIVQNQKIVDSIVHSLLKMQLPYLSKKSKQSASNMKMIVEIYCKSPAEVEPMPLLSNFERLRLKNKVRQKPPRQLISPEQIKNAHLQFNNHHYWHVEGQKQKIVTRKQDILQRLQRQVKIQDNFDYKKWLQENVWGYYD